MHIGFYNAERNTLFLNTWIHEVTISNINQISKTALVSQRTVNNITAVYPVGGKLTLCFETVPK